MSSQHLLGLIEDVLDLAKVEAGRIEVAHERALAVNAIAEALALVSPQAAEQGITVEAPCTDDPGVSYVGDEDRVRQILVNLLSNAVKFTEPGGRITITCATEAVPAPEAEAPDGGRWTCIRVTDTGIGIAPEDMDKVFRPFEQVEEGRTRTRGGTGLGLTISRDLARLMGGDLTVRSERGEGSTFTLWLPGEAALRPSLDESVLERTRQGRPRGLAEAGEAVQDQMDSILSAYVARLRRDPLVPRAASLGRVNLEDHASSFLSDIAQSLVSLASGEVDVADLLRDGTEIQQLISKLHGAQRARLGWTEVALRREFAILREETEAAVRRKLSPGEADVDEAVGLLHRFFEHAERVSLRGLRSSIPAGGG